jgi:peptide/nickel transport system ATP-binding protein
MRQRVTIALATILWPKLILADEPTTALDVVVQRGVIQLLREIQQRESSTLVLITHDMGVHANLADRIAVLYAGKVVEEADTRTILTHPRHPGRPPALDNPPGGCRFHPRCPEAMDRCRSVAPPLIQIDDSGHRAACHVIEEELSHATRES